ncbi:Transport protein particle (TRAPP) component Bet5 [Monocercomonoides exilis]|uniref:Transport protein particle (TRAPP) component Bet5 n=1 Tax=Monocercomonoides exilis TaxID=2049356 RepID=UPI00355A4E71|nr:Transport protein particle (TRAPP) component Bet5 [Monocercomonoides exilis]|eukprot:MONOS_12478.1-p1 / transcript=MONOS_12478.1 / gene=MONOS_12478 / organism=Monocercomonoides_exilis_PA203 / gene_product= Transport protein particle (TRAPP) component Bet5 / transcript_product= Transport protein particle (TRAPP) component Bet5 / location=Mono_scaffold00694:8433-9063(-) / protein_length=148 / sequence_SO=supercontig / SO=protein_coding / is_pseudo=false
MPLFSFFIFSPQGECIYSKEYPQITATVPQTSTSSWKLLIGLLMNLKFLTSEINPRASTFPHTSLHCYSTKEYKIHCYETLPGVRFVVCTDSTTKDLRGDLMYIYSNLYVEYVMKNPFYTPGEYIRCIKFEELLDEKLRSLPCFSRP